jgi:hypothetical protein
MRERAKLRGKLTYANVMSTLCFFLLVGGGAAYAASHLGKNSVGSKQLKKNAVTTAKLKNGSVTGAKIKRGAITGKQIANGSLTGKQINSSTLGTVPTAQTANTLGPSEGWHEVGAPGEPPFLNGWKDFPPSSPRIETLAFYKDHGGIVHFKGQATGGSSGFVFQLPAGYRPASNGALGFLVSCGGCGPSNSAILEVDGSDIAPGQDGAIVAPGTSFSVEGITFRAES